jgi:hypothetical protein
MGAHLVAHLRRMGSIERPWIYLRAKSSRLPWSLSTIHPGACTTFPILRFPHLATEGDLGRKFFMSHQSSQGVSLLCFVDHERLCCHTLLTRQHSTMKSTTTPAPHPGTAPYARTRALLPRLLLCRSGARTVTVRDACVYYACSKLVAFP